MLYPPFDIISCSWPRPVDQADGRWTSEPDWDAPLIPMQLQPHWDILNGEVCWTIDWRDLLRNGLENWGSFHERRDARLPSRLPAQDQ